MAKSVEKYRRKDPNIKHPLGHARTSAPHRHYFFVKSRKFDGKQGNFAGLAPKAG
jgi:hypothetical protein